MNEKSAGSHIDLEPLALHIDATGGELHQVPVAVIEPGRCVAETSASMNSGGGSCWTISADNPKIIKAAEARSEHRMKVIIPNCPHSNVPPYSNVG